MSEFEQESRRWQIDVEAEAARLIRLGVAPWHALIQARQRVAARRRCEAIKSTSEVIR